MSDEKGVIKDLSDHDWHRISIKKALRLLDVAPKAGLHATEAQRRAAQYGANRISPPPIRMLPKVVGWVFGGFGSLLLAASIFCFIAWKPLGNPNPQGSNLALAVILFVFVIFQVVLNAWQECTTSRIMASDLLLDDVIVVRDGVHTSLPATSLVPGDIVRIVEGQKVPADMKLIEVRDGLRFDRSMLTGESEPFSGHLGKSNDNILEAKNIALQGTLCISGSGLGLVFQVGGSTVFGRTVKLASATSSPMTSLERDILRFILTILGVAALLVIFVLMLNVVWLKNGYPYIQTPTVFANVASVIVAFLPEGLPTLVMLCLVKEAHTPSKHKVRYKSLSIIETLGSVNVLCLDMTDSLTQNQTRVDVTFDLSTLRRTCQDAGIRFFVMTGDHPTTAISIDRQTRIISNSASVHHAPGLRPVVQDLESARSVQETETEENDDVPVTHSNDNASLQRIITGAELETLISEQENTLDSCKQIIFSHLAPEQKLRLVRSLQARGCIVAVTGAGVSDAPALRAADCGIAIGNRSDIAREAADVVVEDLSAIVVALKHGRLVHDNLQKMVLYLLPAGSFSQLMPVLLRILIGIPQLLGYTQMILICIAIDILPALSLCFEPPEHGLLCRPPRNVRKDPLVNRRLLRWAFVLGIIESLCAMSMSVWFLQRNGVPFSSLVLKFGDYPATLTSDLLHEAQSVYFITLVVMQWGNLLSTRTRRSSIFQQPPWRVNCATIPAAICALLIAVFFSYVPAFHHVFETSDIPARHFFIPITFALALVVLDETRKLIIRTFPRGFVARWAW